MRKRFALIAALFSLAAFSLAFSGAGPAMASTTQASVVRHSTVKPASVSTYNKKIHLACATGGYTFSMDQFWTIVVYSKTVDPSTSYTENSVNTGTSPHFDANKVVVTFTTSSPDQELFHIGDGTSNSVPNTITGGRYHLFGGSAYGFNELPTSPWTLIEGQKMVVYGVGAGSATATCTDSTPTASDY